MIVNVHCHCNIYIVLLAHPCEIAPLFPGFVCCPRQLSIFLRTPSRFFCPSMYQLVPSTSFVFGCCFPQRHGKDGMGF